MIENKKVLILLWTIIALIVITLSIAHVWKSSLRVTNFAVEGNMFVSNNEILQLIGIQKGALLFNVDLGKIEQNVCSHYYIKTASARRNLPNTITVTVEERKPIALLNSSLLYYVDEDGVILPKSVTRKLIDLPVLSGTVTTEKIRLGMVLTSQPIQEALTLLKLMKTLNRPLYHGISEVRIERNGDIQLITAEDCVPVLIGSGEIEEKFVIIEAFWEQYIRAKGTSALKYVDMRFTNKVFVRWQNSSKQS